jgi:ribosomal protein S18 acetylase RimI-like enzyme
MKIIIKQVMPHEAEEVKKFLVASPQSLKTFRYFSSRPLSILNGHLLTLLAYDGGAPCGYGHLDQDGDKIWLGVCVADSFVGQGIGSNLMVELVGFADARSLPLQLSVDSDNSAAIHLYKKFKFRTQQREDNITFMRRE